MKKYSEQLFIIAIAILLHFGFGSNQPPTQAEVERMPLESWVLETTSLVGDTLISLDYDPFFKTPKTFRAFPLRENLQHVLEQGTEEDLVLIFHCTDGYKPSMPLKQVLSSNGYLAYQDVATAKGDAWADSLASKFPPFYLVWPKVDSGDKSFARPYGLERIEFKSFEEEFSAALPKDEALKEGFTIFSNTCMRCHSVNKVGGNMAPEFNYPKNITEYWQKEDIWAFIQNPRSFRFNSKMPSMTNIDRQKFEKVYAYLKGMKDHKGE